MKKVLLFLIFLSLFACNNTGKKAAGIWISDKNPKQLALLSSNEFIWIEQDGTHINGKWEVHDNNLLCLLINGKNWFTANIESVSSTELILKEIDGDRMTAHLFHSTDHGEL